MVSREDLRRNPGVLYVFGDNLQRAGRGGQAREMRGEPNAVGVATKIAPDMGRYAFFTDDPGDVIAQNRMLDEDMKPLFEHVKRGGIIVWPADGIGTGLSDLPNRSPHTWDYLQQKFAALLKAAAIF